MVSSHSELGKYRYNRYAMTIPLSASQAGILEACSSLAWEQSDLDNNQSFPVYFRLGAELSRVACVIHEAGSILVFPDPLYTASGLSSWCLPGENTFNSRLFSVTDWIITTYLCFPCHHCHVP